MRRLDVGECNEESDPSDIVLLDIALADETVINLAERLTVRWRRAAESRFSLCSARKRSYPRRQLLANAVIASSRVAA
jgi:hypothetical protein